MSSVKRATICSLCIALCFVLPLAFHALGLGSAFSPMHLPVLLCGLVCGGGYGLFCGIAGPILSSFSGMPSAVQLIYFIPELGAYGFFSGWLYGRIHTGRKLVDLYLALVPAMLIGRVLGGAVQAIFYISTARAYSPALWATGYLIGTAPGMLVQLLVLPAIVEALERAHTIPVRYAPSAHGGTGDTGDINGNHTQEQKHET